MSTDQLVAARPPILLVKRPWRPPERGHPRRSDFRWGIAFIAPYAAVLFAFIVYPFGYALWIAKQAVAVCRPDRRSALPADRGQYAALRRPRREREDVPGPAALRVLPAPPLVDQGFAGCLRFALADSGGRSLHLIPLDAATRRFGRRPVVGAVRHRRLGVGANVVAYTWKWMPFCTVIFLAARMTIPRDIYDSAEVDGAIGVRRFVHITFPLLANLYLVCTLLSTLWTLGDFTTVFIVSGGGPGGYSNVLATLGFHYAFDTARPALGVAAVMSALPVLIPIVIVLMRRFHASEVRL